MIKFSGYPLKVRQEQLQDYELLLATLLPSHLPCSPCVPMRVNNFEDALTVLNTEYSGTLAGDSPDWILNEGCKLSMLVQYAVRAVKRPCE